MTVALVMPHFSKTRASWCIIYNMASIGIPVVPLCATSMPNNAAIKTQCVCAALFWESNSTTSRLLLQQPQIHSTRYRLTIGVSLPATCKISLWRHCILLEQLDVSLTEIAYLMETIFWLTWIEMNWNRNQWEAIMFCLGLFLDVRTCHRD